MLELLACNQLASHGLLIIVILTWRHIDNQCRRLLLAVRNQASLGRIAADYTAAAELDYTATALAVALGCKPAAVAVVAALVAVVVLAGLAVRIQRLAWRRAIQ